MDDYNRVRSLTPEEFKALVPTAADLENRDKFTKSDDQDISKMERLLDLRPGALKDDSYYLERATCSCGRLLTMYDFVFTGLVDAGHPKSFILHTFVGNKLIVNEPRPVRCSACGTLAMPMHKYSMGKYGCHQKPIVRNERALEHERVKGTRQVRPPRRDRPPQVLPVPKGDPPADRARRRTQHDPRAVL